MKDVFHPLARWDTETLMRLFRERLLARLIDRHAISAELARKLLAWHQPGFSAFVGAAILFEDKKAIEDVACYIVRAPLSLRKLVYLDGQKAVLYRSKLNPSLGRNFEAMDPLEWLARMADHVPDSGRHRTNFYAHYANRVRGERPPEPVESERHEAPPKKRRFSPTWGRLIAKVYHVDPLLCARCGRRMSIVAFVTAPSAVRKILDHLGLSTPEAEKPPPPPEVLRVAEHGEGWGVPADWE